MKWRDSVGYRAPALLAILLTAVLASGAAVFTGGRSTGTGASHAIAARSTTLDCSSVTSVVAAGVAAAAPGATSASVTTARSRAVALARTTASDDIRELVQNLADDLAAFGISVVHSSSERRSDASAALRGDLAALRRACVP